MSELITINDLSQKAKLVDFKWTKDKTGYELQLFVLCDNIDNIDDDDYKEWIKRVNDRMGKSDTLPVLPPEAKHVVSYSTNENHIFVYHLPKKVKIAGLKKTKEQTTLKIKMPQKFSKNSLTKMTKSAIDYYRLKNRHSNPNGEFDKQGRFYLHPKYSCCEDIRCPSRSYPYSEMTHGRTILHTCHTHKIITDNMTEKEIKNVLLLVKRITKIFEQNKYWNFAKISGVKNLKIRIEKEMKYKEINFV